MNDRIKAKIISDIIGGKSDSDIISEQKITTGTLMAIASEYETIKNQLEQMRTVSEISEEQQLSVRFIENIKSIIETGQEILNADPPPEEEIRIPTPTQNQPQRQYLEPDIDDTGQDTYTETDQDQLQESEPETEPEQEPEEQEKEKETKKAKSKLKALKKIDDTLKTTAELSTASVLVTDAGDIGKAIAIQRQELGRYVMETMGTVAGQFGFTSYREFITTIYNFWINNQGKIGDLQNQIEELTDINQQLQDSLDMDIVRLFIAKSIDRITVAALMGGGTLDLDSLIAYKNLLLTNPDLVKMSMSIINNKGGEQIYA